MESNEGLGHHAFRLKCEKNLRLHAPLSAAEKEFMRTHSEEIKRYVLTIMQNIETRPKAKVLLFTTFKAAEIEQR
jgi:hypothetical protein